MNGREGLIIAPNAAAAGKPWVWRTEFFDAFAQADMALLQQGYHIAYYRLNNLYGCPGAIRFMEVFRQNLIRYFELAWQAALFGFSRGGLYALNYAAHHPQGVSSLCLDAPVLDICSWPGGKGAGTGHPVGWEDCLAVYGLTEEEAERGRARSWQQSEPVAASGIPVLIVSGDADEIVPLSENGFRLEQLE